MRQLLLSFIFLGTLFSQSFQAQILQNEDARKIKNSKAIIGLSGNVDSLSNAEFLKAVQSDWTLTEIIDTLPLAEAFNRMKKGGIIVIHLGIDYTTATRDLGNGTAEINASSGGYIGINTKGTGVADLKQYLTNNSKSQCIFGISMLQDIVNTMIDENLKSIIQVNKVYKKRFNEMTGKKLVVCKEYLHEKITIQDIKTAYGGDVEILEKEDFENAIINKLDNTVYLNFASVPVGDTKSVVGYIVGCDDQKTYSYFLNGKYHGLDNGTLKNLKK